MVQQGDGGRLNVLMVVQGGRLQYEALLATASLMRANPRGSVRLFLAEPEPGPAWQGQDPRIDTPEIRDRLEELGAIILPFEARHFGASYPHGNKIEALFALPEGQPFVFFDTDTLFLAPLAEVPFDFDRPTASNRREGTWPVIELYGPDHDAVWSALYRRFGLDYESSLDTTQPVGYWRRHLYFNAGFFFYKCPHAFGKLFLDTALAIRDDPPAELVCQPIYPWLDQIALPLVIHALGGGRDTLPDGLIDGRVSCHWRALPLLYAREPDAVVALLEELATPQKMKRLLKAHEPFRKLIYQGKGQKLRAGFDRDDLPRPEARLRKMIRNRNLWLR